MKIMTSNYCQAVSCHSAITNNFQNTNKHINNFWLGSFMRQFQLIRSKSYSQWVTRPGKDQTWVKWKYKLKCRMGEYDGIINIKYKVERAGEMPILEDIWTTPANLQIKSNCTFTNAVFCDVELFLKRYILNQPYLFQIRWAFGTQRIADEQRSQVLVDLPQPGAEQQLGHYDLIGTVQKSLPSCFSHYGSFWGIRHIGCHWKKHIGCLFWLNHHLPLYNLGMWSIQIRSNI